jgi:hypothetical protein
MTVFETCCHAGHRVRVAPSQVRTTPDSYGFACPECRLFVWKPSGLYARAMFRVAGVPAPIGRRELTMFLLRLDDLNPHGQHHDCLSAVAQAEVTA